VTEDGGNGATTSPATDEEGAGSQDTAADGEPGSAEAESGQPTVAPSGDTPATADPVAAEPEEELAPANDNQPIDPLPATGTE
jgi:hypothetical protein